MRTRLLLSFALLGVLVVAAPASSATSTAVSASQIAAALAEDPVFVEDGAQVPLDAGRVRDAVQDSAVRVYVAAVSEATAQAAGGAQALAPALGTETGDRDAAVLVLSEAGQVFAGEGGQATARGVDASTAIEAALAASGGGEFSEAAVTAVVVDFVQRVDAQATGAGAGAEAPGQDTAGGSGVLLPLLAVGAVGGGGYALVRSRRRRSGAAQEQQDARADVESLYGRLGSDVQLLSPGDDVVARQSLADAAERYNATGALMAKADTPGEWVAARRTAVEGLLAARAVRERLGLDPGPEVAMSAGPDGDGRRGGGSSW